MLIHKKFLDKKDFKNLQSEIMSGRFPWYFSDGVVDYCDPFFQFYFLFYKNGQPNCDPKIINMIKPILDKLKIKKLYRVKANLNLQTNEIIEHGFHTDCDDKKSKTAIYYINTCNGYTKFKGNKKIKSVANKLIEFNSQIKHTGSSCTDKKRRVIINFNYI
jgi:hypothetical protein